MDTISHGLTGLLIAEAGFRQRLGPAARVTAGVAAVFPDTDFISSLWGRFVSLEFHRSATHSLLGAVVVALVIAAVVYRFSPCKRYGPLVALAMLGLLSHIFLDLVTSYGTLALWPFTRARFAWDTLFILDPFFTGAIVIPLLMARRRLGPAASRMAALGLAVVGTYIGLAAANHGVALSHVRAEVARQGIRAERVAALPQPLGPLSWAALVLDEGGVHRANLNTATRRPLAFEYFPSVNSDNPYVLRARSLPEVQLYEWFARFPQVTYRNNASGEHVVEWFDLRFASPGVLLPRRPPFFRLSVVFDDRGVLKRVGF